MASRLRTSIAPAGCLGQDIEELLDVGQEVLPLLPPDAKASLMAIARRQVGMWLLRFLLATSSILIVQYYLQRLLDDSALALLIDSSWTCLDLYGSNVTDSGVQQALANTPQLLLLDLSGCKVSQQTIRKLGSWCPQLQVLRIGWSIAFVLAFIQLGLLLCTLQCCLFRY